MHDYPHHYKTTARAEAEGLVRLEADGLPTLPSAPPAEFDGPGDQWSPETLLTAAVADCFVLTFRAMARASSIEWSSLECQATGKLERIERTAKFTRFDLDVTLVAAPGTDEGRARRVLEKAENACLITNSLSAEIHLNATVTLG